MTKRINGTRSGKKNKTNMRKSSKAIRHRCYRTAKPLTMGIEREPCPVSY